MVFGTKYCITPGCPTNPFAILVPRDQEIGEFYVTSCDGFGSSKIVKGFFGWELTA